MAPPSSARRSTASPAETPASRDRASTCGTRSGFTLRGNRVRYSRDGFYIQSSANGLVAHNLVSDVRYGLHYMFSDDNVFEDNAFERSAAGAALMYSKRLVFRRNRFLHNRGFASVGLLMQACDDVVAEDNLIADNARGVFLEGTHHDVFRRNVHRRLRCRARPLRLGRGVPLRGQRRSSATCRRSSSSAAAPTRCSTATTGPTTRRPISTATACAIGRTASRTSSTTCAAT